MSGIRLSFEVMLIIFESAKELMFRMELLSMLPIEQIQQLLVMMLLLGTMLHCMDVLSVTAV